MGKKIATVFWGLVSAFAFILGVITFLYAASVPGRYNLYSASAVQISQVYSEATYHALMGIGAILIALFIQLISHFDAPNRNPQLTAIASELEETKKLVARVGALIQTSKKPPKP